MEGHGREGTGRDGKRETERERDAHVEKLDSCGCGDVDVMPERRNQISFLEKEWRSKLATVVLWIPAEIFFLQELFYRMKTLLKVFAFCEKPFSRMQGDVSRANYQGHQPL